MNKLLLFFVLICTLHTLSAQEKNTEIGDIPKKTNTITIFKEGTAQQILTSFALHLQDNGYSIEKLDKDLLSLFTDFKEYKFAGVSVMKIVAFARQVDNKVKLEIRGKIEISSPGNKIPFEICKCGMVGDARLNAFKEMLSLVEKYSYDTIEFSVK